MRGLWVAASQIRSAEQASHLDQLRHALMLDPRHVPALIGLGNLLHTLRRFDEAIEAFQRALAVAPQLTGLHLNLAVALQASKRLGQALAHCRAAVAAMPESAPAHCTLATMLQLAGDLESAEEALRAAVQFEPRNALAWEDLGGVLSALGRPREALVAFEHAVALAPERLALRSSLIVCRLYLAETVAQDLRRELQQFDALAQRIAALVSVPTQTDRPAQRRERIRVGYVSADLREHSVAYFLEPVLKAHDRARFEVFCYSLADDNDHVTARLRALSGHWLSCGALSDEQLAQRIRSDEIDVLVDLSGHTAGNRLALFAVRPARLQVSWIGFPGETGLRAIDAVVGDACVEPEAESVIRLPVTFSCYQAPPDAPVVGPSPFRRHGHLTLGSFNHVAKISDVTVALWARVLREISDARLFLKHRSLAGVRTRAWMLDRFSKHGVETRRITLAPRDPATAAHLQHYGKVDIALDPFPYCGVTTTCEALWMGVPVVSLVGEHFASRAGLSILSAIGHPEWAAHSPEAYAACVRALAADPVRLEALRAGLRTAVACSPLTDAVACTRAWESAIVQRLAAKDNVAENLVRVAALTDGHEPS